MTDIQAAVGRVQLNRLTGIVAGRRAIAAMYREGLSNVAEVSAPIEPSWARSNWQSYCVTLASALDQKAVMQSLLDVGVSTRRGVMNSHLEEAYSTAAATPLSLSVSSQQQGLILPLLPNMLTSQVRAVLDGLTAAVGRQSAIAAGC
jgi:dTDP-4-amino-4,6-dideoxygalactose transaminase